MTPEEYTLVQDRLIVMADFVRNVDFDAFIRRVKTTKKAAPILDPAIYTDLKDWQAIEAVAEAGQQFQHKIESIKREWRRRRSRKILKGES